MLIRRRSNLSGLIVVIAVVPVSTVWESACVWVDLHVGLEFGVRNFGQGLGQSTPFPKKHNLSF